MTLLHQIFYMIGDVPLSQRYLAVSRHARCNIFAEKFVTLDAFTPVYNIGISVDCLNSCKVISETVWSY